MLPCPKLCPADTTVAGARDLLRDDHVHAVVVVDGAVLLAVVERADLVDVPSDAPAREYGRLRGRVVGPDEDLAGTWTTMLAEGRRRLAVVDAEGRLLGLLCLKRRGHGFCSQADVEARARERRRGPTHVVEAAGP
jgi:CBS domain-containing protein